MWRKSDKDGKWASWLRRSLSSHTQTSHTSAALHCTGQAFIRFLISPEEGVVLNANFPESLGWAVVGQFEANGTLKLLILKMQETKTVLWSRLKLFPVSWEAPWEYLRKRSLIYNRPFQKCKSPNEFTWGNHGHPTQRFPTPPPSYLLVAKSTSKGEEWFLTLCEVLKKKEVVRKSLASFLQQSRGLQEGPKPGRALHWDLKNAGAVRVFVNAPTYSFKT